MAPFDAREVPVRPSYRGISYGGIRLGFKARSLDYHLVQRVMIDRQWRDGTTAAEFLTDISRAARASDARLAVYGRRGGGIAVAVADTGAVLPVERRGEESLPRLLVVYSADRAMILTAYQFSDLAVTGIPGDALWLRR